MAQRQAFLLNVGGTLSYRVRVGTPSAGATCEIFDENAASAGTPAVTITSATLTAAASAGVCDAEAEGYRVRWSFTVSGTAYLVDDVFDVVRTIATAPCDQTSLLAQFPLLTQRYPRGLSSHSEALSQAWEEIQQRIRVLGRNPNRIVGTGAFEQAQGTLAAARIAEQLAVGDGEEWTQRSLHWRRMGEGYLQSALDAPGWYDTNSNLIPGTDEKRGSLRTIVSLR